MCDPVPTGADESGFIPHAMEDAPYAHRSHTSSMDLTTVRQPVIDGGQPGSPHDIQPTELIVRASTGPCRTDTE